MDVIITVIGHATAGAAQGKGGANDGGQADVIQRLERDLHARVDIKALGGFGRADNGGTGVFQPDPVHGLAKQLAVFGHFNGLAVGANQLDVEFF